MYSGLPPIVDLVKRKTMHPPSGVEKTLLTIASVLSFHLREVAGLVSRKARSQSMLASGHGIVASSRHPLQPMGPAACDHAHRCEAAKRR